VISIRLRKGAVKRTQTVSHSVKELRPLSRGALRESFRADRKSTILEEKDIEHWKKYEEKVFQRRGCKLRIYRNRSKQVQSRAKKITSGGINEGNAREVKKNRGGGPRIVSPRTPV